jgi:hypothetical protein
MADKGNTRCRAAVYVSMAKEEKYKVQGDGIICEHSRKELLQGMQRSSGICEHGRRKETP